MDTPIQMPTGPSVRGRLLPLIAFASLSVVGCSDEHGSLPLEQLAVDCDPEPTLDASAPTVPVGMDAGVRVTTDAALPPSVVPVITGVTAFGDCRVQADIAKDGSNVSLRIADFSVSLDETRVTERADCDLAFSILTPPGRAYSLEAFSATGRVSLEEGMSGGVEGTYHFTALRDAPMRRSFFGGKVDAPIRFEATYGTPEQSFSPCETNRKLELSLSMYIRNAEAPKSGKIELTGLEGLKFALRPCTLGRP